MKIGNVKIPGKLALAPMAGVADVAFRETCEYFGASYFTSELISVKGLIYDSEKTKELLTRGNIKKPFAVQLFGNNPEDFAKAAVILKPFNFDIVDVNMGCPAPKVVKEKSGSYLLKTPALCGEIVQALKENAKKPITIKIRSGWDKNSITAIETAKECEKRGASAITIHGRTKTQMYCGEVDLGIIKDLKENVSIPIIGNGNITSGKSAEKMLEYTGCDMLAIGRAAYGKPWIFKEVEGFLKGEIFKISEKEKIEAIKKHTQKILKYKGEERGCKEARKHIAWYLKGTKNAAKMREKVFSVSTKKEIEELLFLWQSILGLEI